jgi:hypothetical protein
MSFADEVYDAAAIRKGPKCTIALLIEDLDPETADGLRQVLDDKRVSHTIISRVLRSRGHYVGDSTIGRHRLGKCKCGGV